MPSKGLSRVFSNTTVQKHHNLFHDLFIDTNPVMVKEALALMGKLDLVYRLPLCETTAANRAKIAETLKELGVLK